MGNWSKNFGYSEVACKGENCCGHSAPMHPVLREKLQLLRDIYGKPISITSGFRCNTHNSTVPGAAKNSYHTKGMASDIKAGDMYLLKKYALIIFPYTKAYYGKNNTIKWLHVDVRGF